MISRRLSTKELKASSMSIDFEGHLLSRNLQLKPSCHSSFGEFIKSRRSQLNALQPELNMQQPKDAFDQEVNRMADHAMSRPDLSEQRQDKPEDLKRGVIQAKSLAERIKPLAQRDLSQVRFHTDQQAAYSAHAINSLAYTVGHDIVFGASKYSLGNEVGRRLLTHELTHVLQQAKGMRTKPPTLFQRQLEEQKTTTEPKAPDCALTRYKGSNFVGDTVIADVEFINSLKKINDYAITNDVNIHVTNSFREAGGNIKGAIVTPAKMSNHLAGHAIDMNVLYGEKKDRLCKSKCLTGNLPASVSGFIADIRKDKGLRWGGDFKSSDPVHIDDGLNKNKEAWKARYNATQMARRAGCG